MSPTERVGMVAACVCCASLYGRQGRSRMAAIWVLLAVLQFGMMLSGCATLEELAKPDKPPQRDPARWMKVTMPDDNNAEEFICYRPIDGSGTMTCWDRATRKKEMREMAENPEGAVEL
jgi:uncharacterized protein YceK